MSLKERSYSVLVVSASVKLNRALSELLPESRIQPLKTVSSVCAGRRAWSERNYDFVIINAPLPDEMGVRFAVDVGSGAGAVVLLLVRGEVYDGVREQVTEHGIFTLSKPLNRTVLAIALDWMASARERLRKLEKKATSVEEKMEEIRIVNRAKWLLIDKEGMDEPQAHRFLEKQAMDRCLSKRQVAEEVIRKLQP